MACFICLSILRDCLDFSECKQGILARLLSDRQDGLTHGRPYFSNGPQLLDSSTASIDKKTLRS